MEQRSERRLRSGAAWVFQNTFGLEVVSFRLQRAQRCELKMAAYLRPFDQGRRPTRILIGIREAAGLVAFPKKQVKENADAWLLRKCLLSSGLEVGISGR